MPKDIIITTPIDIKNDFLGANGTSGDLVIKVKEEIDPWGWLDEYDTNPYDIVYRMQKALNFYIESTTGQHYMLRGCVPLEVVRGIDTHLHIAYKTWLYVVWE